MSQEKFNNIAQTIVDNDNMHKTLLFLANRLIENWDRQSCVKESEFLTTKATIEKEAKIKAVRQFIEELEKMAHDGR